VAFGRRLSHLPPTACGLDRGKAAGHASVRHHRETRTACTSTG
jgi:hypothetical protein